MFAGPSDGQKQRKRQFATQLGDYREICRQLGHTQANIALAWLLQNPVLTAPIIGPRTIEHLEESLAAPDISLDSDALQKLEQIWPGPGGEAPSSYTR